MFKETYNRMNEKIQPDAALNAAVLDHVTSKRHLRLRPAIAIVLVLVMMIAAVPVTAAYVPEFGDLLYKLAPELAARLAPVQLASDVNGIRMEVIAAAVSPNAAEIYLTFEDLEGDRLTEGLHAELGVAGMRLKSSSTSSGYDAETGKYTFMVQCEDVSETDVRKLVGQKVSVYVESLDRWLESVETEIPLTLLQEGMTWHQDGSFQILDTDEAIFTVTDAVDIMGMAYVDGKLHVQLHARTLPGYTIPVYGLEMIDGTGRSLHWEAGVVYSYGANRDEHQVEYIFDVAPGQLGEYTLIATTRTVQCFEGPWRVTFNLDDVASDYAGPLSTPLDAK